MPSPSASIAVTPPASSSSIPGTPPLFHSDNTREWPCCFCRVLVMAENHHLRTSRWHAVLAHMQLVHPQPLYLSSYTQKALLQRHRAIAIVETKSLFVISAETSLRLVIREGVRGPPLNHCCDFSTSRSVRATMDSITGPRSSASITSSISRSLTFSISDPSPDFRATVPFCVVTTTCVRSTSARVSCMSPAWDTEAGEPFTEFVHHLCCKRLHRRHKHLNSA